MGGSVTTQETAPGLIGRGALDLDAGDGGEPLRRVAQQERLVSGNPLQADRIEPIDGDPQSNGTRDVRGAGLVFVG